MKSSATDSNEIDFIRSLCQNVRAYIDSIKSETRLFKKFPRGCCRDASLVIGQFLKEAGISDILYCWKERDELCGSHAWLEYKGHIIDITIDQFENHLGKVLVTPLPYDSVYHRDGNRQPFSLAIAGTSLPDLIMDFRLLKQMTVLPVIR